MIRGQTGVTPKMVPMAAQIIEPREPRPDLFERFGKAIGVLLSRTISTFVGTFFAGLLLLILTYAYVRWEVLSAVERFNQGIDRAFPAMLKEVEGWKIPVKGKQ